MQLMSKAEATALALQFQNTVRQRVASFLDSRARQGLVGGVFSYTSEDSVPVLQAVRTALEALGWTVVVDTGARTATIS